MEAFVLLGLLVAAGWVLGVVGFFRAASAHSALRALRREIAKAAAAPIRAAPGWPSDTGRPPSPIEDAAPAQAVPGAATSGIAAPVAPVAATASAMDSAVPPAEPFPAPEPLPAPASGAPPPPPAPKIDLETILAARWGLWLGSAALVLAGVFLIRYAVENALLGPGARCGMAAVLGAALLAAAEWLFRHPPPAIPGPFRPDQGPAGLAAGGVAVLFGAAYGAGPFYGLLPPLPGFVALAIPGFLGLAASLRYGQLTAAIGVVGAFATPALIETDDPSWPGLFLYLTLVTAAALAVVRYTAWTWLGWAATAAGAIWIVIAALQGGSGTWAAAAFVAVAAALNLVLLPPAALDHPVGSRLAWVPFAALAAAGLVLESQVAGPEPRLALFALSPLAVWRGWSEPRLDRLPWLAALFGLLALLFWALPVWHPTGEAIMVEGRIEAFLPGDWAPAIIQPLLWSAGLLAAFHAAAGLWMERRAPRPLHWAALPAAVPVLVLAMGYAQVARFRPSGEWAIAAALLAAALTLAATLALREGSKPRAGVHAAGAAAALALGCAALLHDHWLTLAIALYLPVLAWIEQAADLPPLRRVALAVAGVVLVRSLLNWYVLDYAFGTVPVANGLLAAYAAPAASFALAAWMLRRRADDVPVAVLEAGAIALASVFVALEIRHGFAGGPLTDTFDFNEVASHEFTLAIQAAAYLVLAQRTRVAMFEWAWRVLGGLALAVAVGLLVFNPALTDDDATVATLAAAYLVPAGLAVFARSRMTSPRLRNALGGYALIAGFVWIALQVRQVFHPDHMSLITGSVDDPELWAWSGGWLLYGIALMAHGVWRADKAERLAALGVIALVCAKVFLIDMADLTGLLRVLSFLALGLSLIGLTVVHRRFVLPRERVPDSTERAPEAPEPDGPGG